MKSRAHSIRTGLLTLAIFAFPVLATAQTPPQPVPNPVDGDLFIGVRSDGGEGATDSYLIKIGLDTQFTTISEGTSFNISEVGGLPIGDIGLDLSSKFGSNWHTRTDLFWAIFGTRNVNNPVVYGSKERPSASTPSIPWQAIPLDDRKGTRNAMIDVISPTGSGGYRGRISTVNSLVSTFQPNAGPTTYFARVATPGTTDFSTFSSWSSVETNPSKSLDLYRISSNASTPVTRVGFFSISGSGTITFTHPSSNPGLDPDGDEDGDGVTNGQEEIAGTNPNDPQDFFKVTSIIRSTTSSALAFTPVASRTYVLEYSENLLPPWEEVEEFIAGATPPASHQFTDSDTVRTARPKGFYRIRVSNSTP